MPLSSKPVTPEVQLGLSNSFPESLTCPANTSNSTSSELNYSSYSPQSCSLSVFLTLVNSSTISLLTKPEAGCHLPSWIAPHALSHCIRSILPALNLSSLPLLSCPNLHCCSSLSISSHQIQVGSSYSGHCLKCKSGAPGWLSGLSVRLLVSAQVMISRFVSSSPLSGSVLTEELGACLGLSLSLSLSLSHSQARVRARSLSK